MTRSTAEQTNAGSALCESAFIEGLASMAMKDGGTHVQSTIIADPNFRNITINLRNETAEQLFVSTEAEAGLRCVFGRFALPAPLDVSLQPSEHLLLSYYLVGEIRGETIGSVASRTMICRPRHSLLRASNRAGGFLVHLPASKVAFFQLRIDPDLLAAWCREIWPGDYQDWLATALSDDSGRILSDEPWDQRESRILPPVYPREVPVRSLPAMLAGRGCELLAAFLRRIRARMESGDRIKPSTAASLGRILGQDLVGETRGPPHRLPELREHLGGVSRVALNNATRDHVGTSPGRHLRCLRLERARMLLLSTNLTVIDIASDVGWQCPSKFARAYRAQFGMTPSAERGRVRAAKGSVEPKSLYR